MTLKPLVRRPQLSGLLVRDAFAESNDFTVLSDQITPLRGARHELNGVNEKAPLQSDD